MTNKVNMKYFNESDIDAATERACAYFGCSSHELKIEIVRDGGDNSPPLALAIRLPDDGSSIDNIDSSVNLFYEPDGVYLECYPPKGTGAPLNQDEVSTYLRRKKLSGLNPLDAISAMKGSVGYKKIAPPQSENKLDEEIVVKISRDEMEATAILAQADEGGMPLDMDRLKAQLASQGVVYGIDEDALSRLLSDKQYGVPYIVARGLPPVDGESAVITYHFRTETSKGLIEDEVTKKVNYKELDLFEPVAAGALLVTRTPPTEGTNGCTVKGKIKSARPGGDQRLPKVKNAVINEDKTEIRSSLTGLVVLSNDRIEVSSVYEVPGDCDMGVGNIDFDGSVVIRGGVISGLVIKATGNISIGGVVEASTIIAGGDIELKRGIQGMDRGIIRADGNITVQFVERAKIIAGGDIHADAIIHSVVEVGKTLVLKGKRGNISGGVVMVGMELIAKTIGSVSHTQTDILVGLPPQQRERMKFLISERDRLKEELEKLEKLMVYLDRTGDNLARDREELKRSAKESHRQSSELLMDYTVELSRLEYIAEHTTEGRVHVSGTTFAGVKISIGKGNYKVNSDLTYSTFKYLKGEVVFSSCEKS